MTNDEKLAITDEKLAIANKQIEYAVRLLAMAMSTRKTIGSQTGEVNINETDEQFVEIDIENLGLEEAIVSAMKCRAYCSASDYENVLHAFATEMLLSKREDIVRNQCDQNISNEDYVDGAFCIEEISVVMDEIENS